MSSWKGSLMKSDDISINNDNDIETIPNTICAQNSQSPPKHSELCNKHYLGQNFSMVTENDIEKSNVKNLKNCQIINQREALTSQLLTLELECSICIVFLKPNNQIWSCANCYNIFHLECIKKWFKSSSDDLELSRLRCPTCQKEYFLNESNIIYHCFCGKLVNPEYKRGSLMHSCGDVCSKPNKACLRCPHLCSIQCHPGPCPTCDASITSDCHCSKTTMTVKCTNSESNLICGNKCERKLNCLIHVCQALCHPGKCQPCTETVTQQCYCQSESRSTLCGSFNGNDSSFSCPRICDKVKDCNNHKCDRFCHSGPCETCISLPENVVSCPCGKMPLKNLMGGDRLSCLDPIPSCGKTCNKPFLSCEHSCLHPCHILECPPCTLSSTVRCRCKKTMQTVKCSEIIRLQLTGKSVQCSIRCRARKRCGNHRCGETCCDMDMHICEQICRKQLSCGQHFCERNCHLGNCPDCTSLTFDELYCTCGATVLPPPISCGQSLPICNQTCNRYHPCSHDVLHNCHNESKCPPCTVLISKPCPGGHKNLDNIPCFRPVVTCGSPCQKLLPDCEHECIKDCHLGPCNSEPFTCTQPCTKPRTECSHQCNSPCHVGDCSSVMKSCTVKIEIKCVCSLKSVSMDCHKWQQVTENLKSNTVIMKKNGFDFHLNDKDKAAVLNCDSDCKRTTRLKQNMKCFDMEMNSSDSVSYTSFLREFSTKFPDFLVKIDREFVNLIKKLEQEKLPKIVHRFDPMNREKIRFIHELSKYFGFNSTSSDSDSKRYVTIEAIKGFCKIPNPRLLHFIQKNYPQLFKQDKQASLKYLPHSQTNRLSYSSKMKSFDFSRIS